MLENAKNAGLIGLVGNWAGTGGKVSGIWAQNIEKERDEVFKLDLSKKEDLNWFQDNINAKRIVPYTGDYDMHDVILKTVVRLLQWEARMKLVFVMPSIKISQQ
jgi:insecticidal toxin complex protein TccC